MRPVPPIDYDASQLCADEHALEMLGRLQLAAKRHGTSIRLRNAQPELVDLLALVGFAEVLGAEPESGVEMDGQPEAREEVRVDEEVDPGHIVP